MDTDLPEIDLDLASIFNSAEHEIETAHTKIAKQMEISGSNHQSQSSILLINVKMPTIYEQDKLYAQPN